MSLILSGTDGLSDVDGSAATPAIRGTDANTGIFFGTDIIGFSEGGAECARFNSSGYFGIGTTSPSQLLHVNSAGAAIGIFQSTLAAGNTNVETRYISTNRTWGVGQNIIQASSIFEVADITAGATRLAIDSSGNLGVGTTSPTTKLEVNGNVLKIYDQSTSNANLVIRNTTTGNAAGFNLQQDGVNSLFYNSSNGYMAFATNATERARIDSSGNAFFSGNYTVLYPGSGNTTTGIFLESAGQFCASRNNTVAGRFNRNSSDGILVSFARQGTEVGSVQITTTATSYVTSSDYRLKENIAPMIGALAKVALLKPVTYKWKSNGSDGQGFIAHELQAVVPDCVLGEKDGTQMQPYEITPAVPATYDEDGNELTPLVEAVMGEREVPKYQGVDTSFLVATLTAAIQEQQALITQLTARITALESA